MPSYVLSYVRPDRTAAMVEGDPFTTPGSSIRFVIRAFAMERLTSATMEDARHLGRSLLAAPGTEITHEPSGLVFRIDPQEFPPNVCPCCSALVRPGDHAMAGTEDAYCLGCFTWSRTAPQCLPANTAHSVGYTP
jgi:hypothetical protein